MEDRNNGKETDKGGRGASEATEARERGKARCRVYPPEATEAASAATTHKEITRDRRGSGTLLRSMRYSGRVVWKGVYSCKCVGYLYGVYVKRISVLLFIFNHIR